MKFQLISGNMVDLGEVELDVSKHDFGYCEHVDIKEIFHEMVSTRTFEGHTSYGEFVSVLTCADCAERIDKSTETP